MAVGITNTRDSAKTLIAVKEKNYTGSCYSRTVEIRMSEDEILIDLIEELTMPGEPAPLPLGFGYLLEICSSSILRKFLDAGVTHVFDSGSADIAARVSSSDLGRPPRRPRISLL
ncbi:hypothetical protein B9Z19DRAFT_1129224 [Tuber borchii]|uniref:Fatty acid synthase meander beta sheet domain-containing protein n=1 Tax=Tuber borchii TaxID=42251 RepID=A0A2T6ZMX0_TUBBO|nr:hypothetical protein B9Z19DRAFT_1129224 [Tuber borchii]